MMIGRILKALLKASVCKSETPICKPPIQSGCRVRFTKEAAGDCKVLQTNVYQVNGIRGTKVHFTCGTYAELSELEEVPFDTPLRMQ